MKQEHISEIKAIVILAVAAILLASLVSFVPEDLPWYTSQPNVPAENLIRISGAYIAGSLLFVIGYSSYFMVAFLFFLSWNQFTDRELKFTLSKIVSFIVLFSVISSLFSMMGSQLDVHRFERGGIVGIVLSDFLIHYLGRTGATIILFTLGTMALIVTGEFLISPLFVKIAEGFQNFTEKMRAEIEKNKVSVPAIKPKINVGQAFQNIKEKVVPPVKPKPKPEGKEAEEESRRPVPEAGGKKPDKPQIRIAETQDDEADDYEDDEAPQPAGDYTLPSLDLLEDPPQIPTSKIESGLVSGAQLLEQTLNSFGVNARVADIERGPAITRYELEPGPGVKVQKFTTLSNDIALAMKAQTVRIVAPIPGKNRVGIEVPNSASASVYLKEVITHSAFRNVDSKLALALGKDIAGQPLVADLAEMPHLMIAGTTGSGKTVCVNGIIMSMLFNATPQELKFVMVDPKMVELAPYNDLPHLLCPTVTDPKKAAGALNWVVAEMENRYQKLSKAGVRNIKAYNADGFRMPYIVVIIDELADLMQVSAKAVESSITRLAQLSRAVGIHLILATQRPSVDVITGVIKANFPARVSFKVASKIDSRTVLDMNGAETLLGKGDMLFLQPGDAKPTRGQGNFVKDEEINRVITFIKKQQKPVYDDEILKQQTSTGPGAIGEKDEYYDEAVRLVIETNQASVSILQRRLRLGYTRAARLIDMMEQEGIVGPYAGSKARDILVDREKWLLENMKEDAQEQEAENVDDDGE